MRTNDDVRPLVILPCYNEAPRVGKVVREVRAAMPDAAVAVIDDASADASVAAAVAAGATVLRHGCNLGYGAALETGYVYALRHGYAPVLQLDADGQHPAACLPRLMEALARGDADVVIGSRHLEQGGGHVSRIRRTGHRVFAALVRGLTGLHLTDPTSGFQGLNRRALALYADGVFPVDYPDSDVIVMAHLAGLRIREIPVPMRDREGGASMHAGLKPLYYGIKMLLSIGIVLLNVRQWRRWRNRLREESAHA